MPVDVHLRRVRTHPTRGSYWQLRWTIDGLREDETLGYLPPAEAEDLRVKKEAMLRLGWSSPLTPRALRVEDLTRKYLEHLDKTQPGAERYRKAELRWCLAVAEHVGDVAAADVSEITLRELIAGYRDERADDEWTPSKNTLIALMACFRRVMTHALNLGLVSRPPPSLSAKVLADDARPPRELSQAEVRALIKAANEHVSEAYARLIEFCAWCPRRPVALFGLTRAHVRAIEDGSARANVRIWIERDKAGIGRGWCPLTDAALEALAVQLVELGPQDPGALIWPSPTGVAYTSSSVQRELKIAAAAAELADVKFYDLRKFGCTQVYVSTRDLRVVQKFSGHKDVSTLMRRYIYAQPGAAEEVAQHITWASAGHSSGTTRKKSG